MADGDQSLDGGRLGKLVSECCDRLGDLPAAKYFYGLSLPRYEFTEVGDRWRELKRRLAVDDLFEPDDFTPSFPLKPKRSLLRRRP
jgi:hypothetical protein